MGVRVESMVMGPVATNCYYLYEEGSGHAAVIDPPVKGEWIFEHLKKKGLSVDAILLTHGHFDHISGVEALKRQSGATVYAPLAEKELLLDPSCNLSDEGIRLTADRYLEDGETFSAADIPVRFILTPGHTIGSGCYYLEEDKILFSGDTLFEGSVGRTDLPTGSASSLLKSVKEKLMGLPDDVLVLPGHGMRTTIQDERMYNPFL